MLVVDVGMYYVLFVVLMFAGCDLMLCRVLLLLLL